MNPHSLPQAATFQAEATAQEIMVSFPSLGLSTMLRGSAHPHTHEQELADLLLCPEHTLKVNINK